jgi:hypothetical protein
MWNKKIGAMVLLIAITLSAFGFAYAHWSDMVTIKGTVEMGSLTLAFDADEEPYLTLADNEATLPEPKDVGWGEVYYDQTSLVEDVHTGKVGYKIMVFMIHDAYPQYEIRFTNVPLHNIGTVPLIITGIKVWDPSDELNWTWTAPPDTTPATGFFWKDFDGDGVYDAGEEVMNVGIKNFYYVQLEPCESIKGEVDIDFKQPAEECHTYKFAISFEAIQWNKAP